MFFLRARINICIFCLQIRIFGRKINIFVLNVHIFCQQIRICRQNKNIFVGIIYIYLEQIQVRICRQNIHIFEDTICFSPVCWRLFQSLPLEDVFILSVLAGGLTFHSAGLLESSVRYSAKARYRPNEVPLGDFNFKIKQENVDIMNCNPSAKILKGFFLSIETKNTIP